MPDAALLRRLLDGYWLVVAEDPGGCLSPGLTAVTTSTGALLRIRDVRVFDPLPGGDDDGRLGEGELASVFVDLANDGGADLTGATVSLGTSHPSFVVVGPATMDYGSIPAGGSADAPSPFQVRLDPGVPRHVFLVASAEADQGCARDERILEIVARDHETGQEVKTEIKRDAQGLSEEEMDSKGEEI